jgi:hypothetical protein
MILTPVNTQCEGSFCAKISEVAGVDPVQIAKESPP